MAAGNHETDDSGGTNLKADNMSKNPLRMPTFTLFDAAVVVFSLATYLVDTSTDVLVVIKYIQNNDVAWAGLTMTFTVLPSVVMQMFSSRWHINDSKMNWRLLIIHVLQLGAFHRYISVLIVGFRARKTRRLEDYMEIYQQQRDVAMLRLFESFMESAPQLVLQLYIMVTTSHWYPLTAISACASLLSLAWAIAAYSKSMRNARDDKRRLGYTGLILQTVWRMGSCASRVVALVMLAAAFKGWMCLALGMHWVGMTLWIFAQKTDFCDTWWEERMFNVIVGAIYCFSFFNLKEGMTRYRLLAFELIMLSENTAFMCIVYVYGSYRKDWFTTTALVIVWGGFFIGSLSMVLYYRFFHPNGPIKICSGRVGDVSSGKLDASLDVDFLPRSQTASAKSSPARSDTSADALKYMIPSHLSPLQVFYCTEVCCSPDVAQKITPADARMPTDACGGGGPPRGTADDAACCSCGSLVSARTSMFCADCDLVFGEESGHTAATPVDAASTATEEVESLASIAGDARFLFDVNQASRETPFKEERQTPACDSAMHVEIYRDEFQEEAQANACPNERKPRSTVRRLLSLFEKRLAAEPSRVCRPRVAQQRVERDATPRITRDNSFKESEAIVAMVNESSADAKGTGDLGRPNPSDPRNIDLSPGEVTHVHRHGKDESSIPVVTSIQTPRSHNGGPAIAGGSDRNLFGEVKAGGEHPNKSGQRVVPGWAPEPPTHCFGGTDAAHPTTGTTGVSVKPYAVNTSPPRRALATNGPIVKPTPSGGALSAAQEKVEKHEPVLSGRNLDENAILGCAEVGCDKAPSDVPTILSDTPADVRVSVMEKPCEGLEMDTPTCTVRDATKSQQMMVPPGGRFSLPSHPVVEITPKLPVIDSRAKPVPSPDSKNSPNPSHLPQVKPLSPSSKPNMADVVLSTNKRSPLQSTNSPASEMCVREVHSPTSVNQSTNAPIRLEGKENSVVRVLGTYV